MPSTRAEHNGWRSVDFPVEIPFARLLGLELVRLEPSLAVLAIDIRPEFTNSWAVAHGGVTMTLLDVAMAHAARGPCTDAATPAPGVATIEMKTSFLLPAQGRLVATARCLRHTAALAFCEASVTRADGEIAAHATGTFKVLRGLPAGPGGRDVRRPALKPDSPTS